MIGSSFGSDHPEWRTAEKHGGPNPDESWRTAGRKLCWSPAAPPASGYGSPSRWPKMKRSVTMVKMRFLLHCFFNRSLSATDSTVRHREPVSVFTFSCEDASIAPELFYAQSSVEFHARLSVFKGGRIGKSVCGVHSDMQPRWDRIHVPFVKRRGSVSRLFFGSTIIIWKFLQGKALARMPLCQAKYYKSSLVSSLSSDFSRTKPPFFFFYRSEL